MRLFFFDLNDGIDLLNNMIELNLVDESAAKMEAQSWIADITKDLPIGRHEVSVLVRNGGGCPLLKIALTLECVGWTNVAHGRQLTASNEVTILSSTSVLVH